MTVIELLKASGNGKMPKVKSSNPPQRALSPEGQVIEIWQAEPTGGRSGCVVSFHGLNAPIWFYEGREHERFKMSDLQLV